MGFRCPECQSVAVAGDDPTVVCVYCDIAHDRAVHGAPSPDEPVTLKDAAAQLGVTPANLRQAIARGSLHARKVGRDWLVTPAEVERYRRENRRDRG